MRTTPAGPWFLLAFLLLGTLPNSDLRAQDGFSKATLNHIDSALSILDMSRKDCAMRADMVNADHHRLNLITKLFSTPLKSGDFASYYAKQCGLLGYENADLVFTRMMSDAQVGVYRPLDYSYDSTLLHHIKSVRKADGSTVSKDILENLTLSALIRQYIIPAFKAAEVAERSQANCKKHTILVEHCDSLLMMSEEDSGANPYELKAGELRSDSLSRLYFEEAASCDLERICSSGLSLYRQLLAQASSSASAVQLLADSVQTLFLETTYGTIAIGGAQADHYEGDYFLILDVGGNDTYVLSLDKKSAMSKSMRAIVDLSGNDMYLGSGYSLGAGVFGTGLVIDLSGNDTYKASSFSLGAGLFGVGIVHDLSGTDSYLGGVFSQGAGAFGIGLLIDDKGNDLYSVQAYGQGFGFTGGLGALCDKEGNDVYTTQSPFVDILRYDSHFVSFTQGAALGQRPTASGGIGLLVDKAGNDSYTCDIYGQGSAYWFGFAALVDGDGEDRYQAYQYAQGAGIHFAHGLLWDKQGDDVYVSHGVSQGCGHDVGVGVLVDEAGNDSYVAESLSLGGGNANAVSIFVDDKGDDSYIARNASNCFGFSDFRRNYGMIGLFVDAAGSDLYGESERNNQVQTKSSYGVFLDHQFDDLTGPANQGVQGSSAPSKPEPVVKLASTVDSLFIQASTAPQKFQYMVGPARERLIAMGDSGLQYCATRLSEPSPRERLALEYLIPKMYEKDPGSVRALLADSLKSSSVACLNFCMWAVGKCKIDSLRAPLVQLCLHNDWRVRAAAVQQIGEAGMVDAVESCTALTKDTVPNVRMRAAYSLAQLRPEMVAPLCKALLKDPLQIVRNAVGCGLRANKKLSPELLRELLDNNTSTRARRSLLLAISGIDTSLSTESLVSLLVSLDEEEREWGYRLLQELRSPYWITFRERCAQSEGNVTLSRLLLSGSSAAPSLEKSKVELQRKGSASEGHGNKKNDSDSSEKVFKKMSTKRSAKAPPIPKKKSSGEAAEVPADK